MNNYKKKYKKYKDEFGREKSQIKGMISSSVMGVGGQLALGSLGGTVAKSGQEGIAGVFGMMPSVGSVVGAGMMMGHMAKLEEAFKPKKWKTKKKRKTF